MGLCAMLYFYDSACASYAHQVLHATYLDKTFDGTLTPLHDNYYSCISAAL